MLRKKARRQNLHFGEDDVFAEEEEEEDQSKTIGVKRKKIEKERLRAANERSKQMAEEAARTMHVDFDAVAEQESQKEQEEEVTPRKESKFIEELLKSAKRREEQKYRAKENLIRKEVEREAASAKEVFVTRAYKKELEERKVVEAEEAREEEEQERKMKQGGIQSFYTGLLGGIVQTEAEEINDDGTMKQETREVDKKDHQLVDRREKVNSNKFEPLLLKRISIEELELARKRAIERWQKRLRETAAIRR